MNKEDQKKYNQVLTYHYLKEQENGDEVAQMMNDRLAKATTDWDDSIDVGVAQVRNQENGSLEALQTTRSLSSKKEQRSWLQHANIILLFLLPWKGLKSLPITSELHQKQMITMWVDYVADLTASVAMKALPGHIGDLYFNVSPDSKVSVERYRRHLNHSSSNLNIYYKGGKVS
jgi:hypothetical protein